RTHDILRAGDERSALLDQVVRAGRARVERMPGHGEHLPALIGRAACRDERARTAGRLDHHHPEREARDDAVAAREILAPWLEPGWLLAHKAAPFADCL